MDEPQRERDPESYFGAGIGGGSGLFTAGGTPDRPHSPAPAVPSVATVTEPAREVPVHLGAAGLVLAKADALRVLKSHSLSPTRGQRELIGLLIRSSTRSRWVSIPARAVREQGKKRPE